jgi:hypothetical protein
VAVDVGVTSQEAMHKFQVSRLIDHIIFVISVQGHGQQSRAVRGEKR